MDFNYDRTAANNYSIIEVDNDANRHAKFHVFSLLTVFEDIVLNYL